MTKIIALFIDRVSATEDDILTYFTGKIVGITHADLP